MLIQFTLFSEGNKYKPMSTVLDIPSVEEYKAKPQEYKDKAITKICIRRKTEPYYLKKYGYTRLKVRVYDKEKIAQENAERYKKAREERKDREDNE